jgi:mannose-1-phosphate guanylyltransferase
MPTHPETGYGYTEDGDAQPFAGGSRWVKASSSSFAPRPAEELRDGRHSERWRMFFSAPAT